MARLGYFEEQEFAGRLNLYKEAFAKTIAQRALAKIQPMRADPEQKLNVEGLANTIKLLQQVAYR